MYILLSPFTYGANDQSLKPDNKVAYAEVLITLYENGSHEVLLKRSSGNEKLDEKIVNAVKDVNRTGFVGDFLFKLGYLT